MLETMGARQRVLGLALLLSVGISTILGQTDVEPCTVLTGDSHVILSMVESRGEQVDQRTHPEELPISGHPAEDMELKILRSEGGGSHDNLFALSGKRIKLVKPLDRDENDLSSIMFQITCTTLSTGRKRTIPVVITISDVNDNRPNFIGEPYVITIPESTAVNSTVFRGLEASDLDSNVNGQVEFRVEGSEGFFAIDLPHQGLVRLAGQLDYETQKRHFVTIVASDRALDTESRFSVSTTLTVNVMDSDDQDPKFTEETYTAKVISGLVSAGLEVHPEKIRAEDQDTLRSDIQYSFVSGTPAFYSDHFVIDASTGVVSQVRAVDRAMADVFDITVKAEEVSPNRRSTKSRLLVSVMAEDVNPPMLLATATEGFVQEDAPVGERVRDREGNDIKFVVTDMDRDINDDAPGYEYQMTSNSFRVDDDGFLVVNERGLDRDPPNESTLSFQVFARETEGMRKASSPVSLTVRLEDVNDNAPILAAIKDVTLAAGNAKRRIAKLNATDNDSSQHLRFRLLHVSNGGHKRFSVSERTGEVFVVAPVSTGEHFSLTVAVRDDGGKSSQGIMEVRVTDGPNLRGPVFEQFLYETTVSEAASKFSAAVTARAKDPEGGPVRYSLVGGNSAGHFQVEESTGVVRVMQPLDREQIRRYSLTVRAEDKGGKYSTATVNILISDVNDENPVFHNTPYSFRVKEGEMGSAVGKIKAVDGDSDENAAVTYSVPEESPFVIDAVGGEIRTRTPLDFERQPVHYVVVTARDGGREPRIATATVTVLVQDTADEPPIFLKDVYNAIVPENVEDYLVTTVVAEDKDIDSSITYRLIQGDLDKFMVDPVTGAVKTIRGLDYERQTRHTLVVGTEEGRVGGSESKPGTMCRVEIQVEDRNDVAPQFIRLPRGNFIEIRNDVPVGSRIGSVRASDADASPPGNTVRYDISAEESSERVREYFTVHPETGEITIQDQLTKELYDVYRLAIRAYDLGEPSLDATVLILVNVRQVVTISPETGVGFAESSLSASISETAVPGQLVATIPLEPLESGNLAGGSSRRRIRIDCKLDEVVDTKSNHVKGAFDTRLNANGDCDLLVGEDGLDHEKSDHFTVQLRLETLSAYANPDKTRAEIEVTVADSNDNAPRFVYEDGIIQDQYLVAVADDTPSDTDIFSVKAVDLDSGAYGDVRYSLEDAQDFYIEPLSGIVRNRVALGDLVVGQGEPSFELIVVATDNAGSSSDSNTRKTLLVVNLLKPGDGIVLTIANTPPADMAAKRQELVEILQEQTNLAVNIDRMVPSMVLFSNGTCCKLDPTGTDVYFHVTDPANNEVLGFDHGKVQRSISGKQASSNLKYAVSSLLSVQASGLHQPYPGVREMLRIHADPTTVMTRSDRSIVAGWPAALLALGCLVFLLALAAMAYLCVVKRRLVTSEEKNTKTIVVPRYEPVFVEPNFKEYETQVLQMSVPVDDLPDNDGGGIDVSRYRAAIATGNSEEFNLDSISYITKDRLSSLSDSPGSDHTRTTNATYRLGSYSPAGGGGGHYSTVAEDITPIRNPLFKRSDSEEGLRHLSASHTNANVLFGNKSNRDFVSSTPNKSFFGKDQEQQPFSPVDNTTQL